MSKHTPGPWATKEVNDKGAHVLWVMPIKANGHYVAEVGVNSPDAQANARLIAAAPDLLEALEHALAELEQTANSEHIDPKHYFADIYAAIAKANGETP